MRETYNYGNHNKSNHRNSYLISQEQKAMSGTGSMEERVVRVFTECPAPISLHKCEF